MAILKGSKRAQLSMFLILSIVLVVGSLAILHALNTKPSTGTTAAELNQLQLDQNHISSSINGCLGDTTLGAIATYGIKNGLSENLIRQYIIDYIPLCTENFDFFKSAGYTVTAGKIEPTVTIQDDTLIVDLKYPLEFSKGSSKISFEKDTFVLNKKITAKLNPDKRIILISDDKKNQFIIQPGTFASLNGNPLSEISLELIDKEEDGRSNSVMVGMLAIRGTPSGAEFNKPITITMQYDQLDVPSTIDETELKIAYYSEEFGVWIALPTEVDSINNILTSTTTHFTDFGIVMRCTEELNLTEHVTQTLVRQDCESCEDWKISNPPSGIGPLWIESDKITQENKIGEVPSCSKAVVATTSTPPAEKTYYYYDTLAIEGINSLGYTKYAAEGDSCIWTKEGRSPKVAIQDTAHPTPGDDWDILLNASCDDASDQCLITENSFEESTLKYTLKVINGETPNSCIEGKILVRYKGFGIQKNETESYYLCDKEGEEKEMPIIGGTPTQSILSVCTCQDSVCRWVAKEGAIIIDDPIWPRINIAAYTKDGFPPCPEDFEENYLGIKFKTTNVLDTRSRGKFLDLFGDYPWFQYDKTMTCQFDSNTELLIFGSALVDGECWLLVEAQKWVEARLEHPDFYVRFTQVQGAINGTEVPNNKSLCSGIGIANTAATNTGSSTGNSNTAATYVSSGTKCGSTSNAEGVDVSHWEGSIDWTKVVTDPRGVKFAIMKASEGTTFVDDTFATHWSGAKQVGLIRGAYHYMRPGDGKAQAEHFLSVLGSDYGELPPILDLEESGITPAELKDWLDVVEQRTGIIPMIYTSPGYWWGFGGGAEFSRYPLWIAHWGVSCPRIPTIWSNWVIWQYCGDCSVPVTGISSSKNDLNVFNGNLDALKSYVNG